LFFLSDNYALQTWRTALSLFGFDQFIPQSFKNGDYITIKNSLKEEIIEIKKSEINF